MPNTTSGDCTFTIVNNVDNLLLRPLDEVTYRLIPGVMATGILMNLAFLYMRWRLPKMHTTFNIFLAHMSVADLIFYIIPLSFYIVSYSSSTFVYSVPFTSNFACFFVNFVEATCALLSFNMITLIAKERYFAICRRSYQNRLNRRAAADTKKIGTLLSVFAWIVALLVGAFTALSEDSVATICLHWPQGDQYDKYPRTIRRCETSSIAGKEEDIWVIIPTVVNIGFFVISFIINLVAYGYIISVIRRVGRNGQYCKVIRTLLISGIIFFIITALDCIAQLLNLRAAILNLEILTDRFKTNFIFVSQILVWVHSIIRNTYFFVSPYFREGFKDVFRPFISVCKQSTFRLVTQPENDQIQSQNTSL